MTLHFADAHLSVYQGDCREVMATMPAASVNCVVTSPPYWGLRDYGVGGQLGLEATPEEYVEHLVAVFREVRRVLRDDGTVWLNLGDSYANDGKWGGSTSGKHVTALHGEPVGRAKRNTGLKPKDLVGIPWRVAFALQADGWYLRSDIIWAKPNPMPESVTDRPTKAHEYLFLLAKSARYWYDAEAVAEASESGDGARLGVAGYSKRAAAMGRTPSGNEKPGVVAFGKSTRNLRSVWTIATEPYPGAHFATFPQALVEPCVKAGCPDRTCAECGSPWERMLVVSPLKPRDDSIRGADKAAARRGMAAVPEKGWETRRETTGWRATCSHGENTTPGVVLDPFGGSGTTGLVANRLGRRAVLIDLNADYIDQAMRRNAQAPLGMGA